MEKNHTPEESLGREKVNRTETDEAVGGRLGSRVQRSKKRAKILMGLWSVKNRT